MPSKIFLINSTHIQESYAKQEDQDVQGAMELPYRGRGYLGKRRRVEGRVSKFLF
jgi:hypothetical protein